ncbi:branched-chain amino acid transaminase [bacterium]|nr:branched-chain amino acid transaminase [bacterium]
MPFDESLKIWKNGKLVPWPEATLHIASHVVHYGSSVFEGIRCYATDKGSAIFRLEDHIRRLHDSAKIYRMPIPFSEKETVDACVQVVRSNGLKEAYIRPVAWRGYGALGVDPSVCPVDLAVLAWQWGAYLGQEALENGVDVCVSTWRRPAPNTLPTLAKAGANYMNSQLIKMEAKANGFSEGIALTVNGQLSEGSGENLFVVRGGRMLTPPLSASILPGLTRDSVMTLAAELGIAVSEEPLPREILAVADEAFFTGTAAEVTPIRSVDRIPVGNGKRGPVTAAIQSRFFDLIHGKAADSHSWLHFI